MRRESKDLDPQKKAPDLRGFFFELAETGGRLTLYARHHPDFGGIAVDWSGPDLRRRIAGGRRQLLARAIGLHKDRALEILDATAGLGRDACTLAGLGAQVWLAERQPLIHRLLQNGLDRALADPATRETAVRMHLCEGDAAASVASRAWDVIYLDPMYPGHERGAASKKEMQFLRELTGGDADAGQLLKPALASARKRVVVKRPAKAPWLDARKPSFELAGSQARFDVYLITSAEAA